jgi:ubiquinol-cytochrome c reductase subunit 6
MSDIKGTVRTMLEKGQDPKDYLIEICRPQCTALQQKLQRCEKALKNMTDADPELSCMYPLRDWVTCVDACVQPKIHSQLVGNEANPIF